MVHIFKKNFFFTCDRVFHSSRSWAMKAPFLRAVLSGCPQARSSEDVKPPGGDGATFLCVCSRCCRRRPQDDPGPPGSSSPSCSTSSTANPDARARCPSLDGYSRALLFYAVVSLFNNNMCQLYITGHFTNICIQTQIINIKTWIEEILPFIGEKTQGLAS